MKLTLMAGVLGIGLAAVVSVASRQVESYPATNLVDPTVTTAVRLDSATGDFVYGYSIANGSSAQQRINQFFLVSP